MAPKYEYDGELIIVRSDLPPKPAPERAKIKPAPRIDLLTVEEF